MNILINNRDLLTDFGVGVLDYTGVLAFPSERENEREWYNKSGVDRNLINGRFEAKEFILYCYVKAVNEVSAYNSVNTLVDYMLDKKVFVLSLRDTARNIRECFLCERSKTIVPEIYIRQQNSLYVFKLGLKDVNPNAIKYKTTVVAGSVSIVYTKGQTASIFWGDGSNGLVNNSTTYIKNDYAANGLVDIIIDIDKTLPDVATLTCNFTADKTSIIKPDSVQFTDTSTGNISVWSWVITKAGVVKHTSAEQNPLVEFTEDGVYTVTLQVFNEAAGSASETKTNYITVRNARMLVSDAGDFALVSDAGDFGIIN